MKKITSVLFYYCVILFIILSCITIKNTLPSYKIETTNYERSKIVFNDSTYFEVDNVLLPHVVEYLKDCQTYYGKEYVELNSINFLGIYTEVLPYGILGRVYYQQPYGKDYILISPALNSNTKKLKITIYHELAHKIEGKNHVCVNCKRIMSENLNKSYTEDWKILKQKHFKKEPN